MTFIFDRKWLATLTLIVLCHTTTSLFAQQWAEDMIKVRNYDFGTVSCNAKTEYQFKIYNPYLEDVHIQSVTSSCFCTSVSIDKQILKTYESANILAHFNTDKFVGSKNATITVVIDKPFRGVVQLGVRGRARNDVHFEPGAVEFGTVSLGDDAEKNIAIRYTGHANWAITDIKNSNPGLVTELKETGRRAGHVSYQLRVKLSPDQPVGYINERIFLTTNEQGGSGIPLMVQGNVRSVVTVSPDILHMGNLSAGKEAVKKLIIRSAKPFDIKEVTCPSGQYLFDIPSEEGNVVSSRNIHVITVTFKTPENVSEEKLLSDTITITTSAQASPLEVPSFARISPEGSANRTIIESPITLESGVTGRTP